MEKIENKKFLSYRELKAPVTVQMEITPRCNNNCLYCYNHWRGNEEYEKELNLEDSLKVAKKLVDNEIFKVVLTGGEPLLRKDLVYSLANYFSSENISVNMNTNLTLLRKEDINKIKDSGIEGIFAPLSSYDRETYNEITQTKNYEKAIKGIELLVKEKIPLSLNMVVTNLNKSQVYKTGEFVHNLGINSFAATPAIPCLYLSKDLELDRKDIKKTLDDLLNLKKNKGMNVGIVETIPRCVIEDPKEYEQFFGRDCGAGRTTVAISSSGQIRPCTHSPSEYGSILNNDLQNIWEKMAEWRNGDFIPVECNECSELDLCSLGCRESAKNTYGSYKDLDPRSCPNNTKNQREIIREMPEVNIATKFKVKEGLKYREDKEGILVFSKRNSAMVYMNQQYFNFLKFLNKKNNFTIKELYSEFKEERVKEAVSFLKAKGLISTW